jgi:hypothetical protein
MQYFLKIKNKIISNFLTVSVFFRIAQNESQKVQISLFYKKLIMRSNLKIFRFVTNFFANQRLHSAILCNFISTENLFLHSEEK